MKRITPLIIFLAFATIAFAQAPQKTRNVAKTDATAVSARKVSVDFTNGLKAFYSGHNS